MQDINDVEPRIRTAMVRVNKETAVPPSDHLAQNLSILMPNPTEFHIGFHDYVRVSFTVPATWTSAHLQFLSSPDSSDLRAVHELQK
jgi:hypothetical protein